MRSKETYLFRSLEGEITRTYNTYATLLKELDVLACLRHGDVVLHNDCGEPE